MQSNLYSLRILFFLVLVALYIIFSNFFKKKRQIVRHKPKIPKYENLTKENPYIINKPEISLALFGDLNNQKHYYKIISDRPFNLYVGILTPKLEGEDKLPNERKVYFNFLDKDFKKIEFENYPTGIVENHKWWSWYEKYGRKYYWVGPQIGGNGDDPNNNFKTAIENTNYPAGEYYIEIFNKTNKGRYALAVGDIEDFGFLDYLTLPFQIPSINKFWK